MHGSSRVSHKFMPQTLMTTSRHDLGISQIKNAHKNHKWSQMPHFNVYLSVSLKVAFLSKIKDRLFYQRLRSLKKENIHGKGVEKR